MAETSKRRVVSVPAKAARVAQQTADTGTGTGTGTGSYVPMSELTDDELKLARTIALAQYRAAHREHAKLLNEICGISESDNNGFLWIGGGRVAARWYQTLLDVLKIQKRRQRAAKRRTINK